MHAHRNPEDVEALVSLYRFLTAWSAMLPEDSPVRAQFEIALAGVNADLEAAGHNPPRHLHLV